MGGIVTRVDPNRLGVVQDRVLELQQLEVDIAPKIVGIGTVLIEFECFPQVVESELAMVALLIVKKCSIDIGLVVTGSQGNGLIVVGKCLVVASEALKTKTTFEVGPCEP